VSDEWDKVPTIADYPDTLEQANMLTPEQATKDKIELLDEILMKVCSIFYDGYYNREGFDAGIREAVKVVEEARERLKSESGEDDG